MSASTATVNAQPQRPAAELPTANLLDVSPLDNFSDEYIHSLHAGGVGVQLQCASKRHEEFGEALQGIARWRRRIADSDSLLLVTSNEKLDQALREKKVGIVLHMDRVQLPKMIDGAYILLGRDHEAALEAFHAAGVRASQLVYYSRTLIGDGAGEPNDAGLSRLGREVVRAMNHLGILVDLAHASRRTSLDALEVSERPCVFSHGGCRALCDTPRNIDDETIRALAQAGGVVGITMFAPQLIDSPNGFVQPTLDDWIRHVDHVAQLVGVDHVGFGPDSNNGNPPIEYQARITKAFTDIYPTNMPYDQRKVVGMENPRAWSEVWSALLNRGYTEDDLTKIMGGNMLRVLRQTLL